MSDVRAGAATTGTGAIRPVSGAELDVFDCALPDPTRTT